MKLLSLLSLSLLVLGVPAEKTIYHKKGGNVKASIADRRINYGTAPPWDAFDKIKEKCTKLGCNSGTKITYPTTIVSDGEAIDAKVSLSAEGTFNDNGDFATLNQMVELAKTTIANSKYHVKSAAADMTPDCPAGGVPCPDPDIEHFDQYRASSLVVVRAEDKKNNFKSDLSIAISVDIPDADLGACGTATTVGTAIASGVNGIAAGIFTLSSLLCD